MKQKRLVLFGVMPVTEPEIQKWINKKIEQLESHATLSNDQLLDG